MPCTSCKTNPKAKGLAVCSGCRTVILGQMKAAGYLTPLPSRTGSFRDNLAKENTEETKFGEARAN